MKTNQVWHGVRMRMAMAGADPDAGPRRVTFPVDWEKASATALAGLAQGTGEVSIQHAAEAWIAPIAREAPELAGPLHTLLLHRQAAPDAPLWQRRPGGEARFLFNLPAFIDTGAGFETAAFDAAVETAVLALAVAAPEARTLSLGITDLAGFIAAHGADYGSEQGRALARLVATRLRARLHALAERPRLAARTLRTGAFTPGLADALLGAETGGIAPAFAPVGADGGLTRAARAFLAARGLSNAAALAAQLSGEQLFNPAVEADHRAMRAALAGLLDTMPAEAAAEREPQRTAPARRDLPARHAGCTQKASLGGHRVYVRTGEYPDGTLGEISIALPKDGPAMRGLMEAFAAAVSIGLQHDVPLGEYVEAFVQTRFGPAGAVEGDPAVVAASSVPDYVFRHLAANYLGRHDLPAAVAEEPEAPRIAPQLPLDLPADPRARRRNFRVVGG